MPGIIYIIFNVAQTCAFSKGKRERQDIGSTEQRMSADYNFWLTVSWEQSNENKNHI